MLFHRRSGTGEPLVLLHGLFGSLENLGGLARCLAKDFEVYSVDLPNHGRSAHIVGGSLKVMADQLNHWLDDQGLTRVNLIGHSLGGKVAMELALMASTKIKSLVIIDIAPVSYARRHNDVFAGLLSVDLDSIERRSEVEQVLAEFIHDPEVRSFLLKNLVKRGDNGFAWRINLNDLNEQYEQLICANREGQFSGPVLFIKGGDSDYLQPKDRPDVLQRFPNAQMRVVSNAGHWVHAEKPEVVSGIILKFITGLETNSSE
jgi:esterase